MPRVPRHLHGSFSSIWFYNQEASTGFLFYRPLMWTSRSLIVLIGHSLLLLLGFQTIIVFSVFIDLDRSHSRRWKSRESNRFSLFTRNCPQLDLGPCFIEAVVLLLKALSL